MYIDLSYVPHIRFGHTHWHIIDGYVHFIFLNSCWTLIFHFYSGKFWICKQFWTFICIFWYHFKRFWNMVAGVRKFFFGKCPKTHRAILKWLIRLSSLDCIAWLHAWAPSIWPCLSILNQIFETWVRWGIHEQFVAFLIVCGLAN